MYDDMKRNAYRHLAICFLILFAGCSKPEAPVLREPDFPNVNVKKYGATGDGITDDSRSFELAMRMADSAKLPVYIPAGIYKVRLTILYDNLRLVGQLQPDEQVNTGSIILGKIDCNYKQNITIENLGIDSRGQLGITEDAALTSGINADTLQLHQKFKNLTIIGDGFAGYKHAILCQSGADIMIKNMIVSGFYHGIAIRCRDVNIDSVIALNCGYTSIVVKSDLGHNHLTRNVVVNHVTIKGNPDKYERGGSVLVVSWGSPLSITENVSIENVTSLYGGEACVLVRQVEGLVRNVSIKNCRADFQGDSNQRACYDVDGGTDISFTNCVTNHALGFGFRSHGNARNVRVMNSYEYGSLSGNWYGSYQFLELNGITLVK